MTDLILVILVVVVIFILLVLLVFFTFFVIVRITVLFEILGRLLLTLHASLG
jgi:hypothetical protein